MKNLPPTPSWKEGEQDTIGWAPPAWSRMLRRRWMRATSTVQPSARVVRSRNRPLAVGASVLDGIVEEVEPRLGDGLKVWRRRDAGRVDAEDAGDATHGGRVVRSRLFPRPLQGSSVLGRLRDFNTRRGWWK